MLILAVVGFVLIGIAATEYLSWNTTGTYAPPAKPTFSRGLGLRGFGGREHG